MNTGAMEAEEARCEEAKSLQDAASDRGARLVYEVL